MEKKDYYKILQVPSNASYAEIKGAYRKLVHKFHPDVAGNTPEVIQKFKDITEAYDILSSPEKRERYDSMMKLYEYSKGSQGRQGTYNNSYKATAEAEARKRSSSRKENVFSNMHERVKNTHKRNVFADSIENLLKNVGNKPQQKRQTKQKSEKIDGKDITVEVEISVLEATNGVEKVVNILHIESCTKCRGKKFINGATCSECGGTGEKSIYKKLTVKIPAGVTQNNKIRVENEGNAGFNGGKNGDLYLVVKLKNEPDVKYEGLNVVRTVPIEPFEAVLGGFIDVKGVDSNVIQMKLMPNTYSGQKYRIAQQGLSKDGKKGDLIIVIKIDIPKNLSNAELALYKQLGQLSKKSLRETANE